MTPQSPDLGPLLPRLYGQWPLLLFTVWQPQLDAEANEIELVTWQRELKARDRSNVVLTASGPHAQWLLAVGFDETEATLQRLGNRLVFGLPPGTPPRMALLTRTGEIVLITRESIQLLPLQEGVAELLPSRLNYAATAVAGSETHITQVVPSESPYGPAVARSLGQIG